MINNVLVKVYVDKNKNMLLVPLKKSIIGYRLYVEPYKKLGYAEWENVAQYCIKLLKEISENPVTEATKSDVFKKISGGRGFKQFTKKHICINVEYNIDDKMVTVSNNPRLSDGSYGVEKGTLSEKYSIEYTSEDSIASIQANFLKAYKDAEAYLKEIGGSL